MPRAFAAALATARLTPRIALAPSRPLLGVPSSASIVRSRSRWSSASRPSSASAISPLTAATALCTPLPRYRPVSPSRNSTASCAPVEAPDGTAARPKLPSSNSTSTSTVGLPLESRISRPWMSMIAVIRELRRLWGFLGCCNSLAHLRRRRCRGLLCGGTERCKPRWIRTRGARFDRVRVGSMERDIMAETAAKTTKPRKTAAAKSTAATNEASGTAVAKRSNRDEAKSRFNAALEEARAGAAALGAEAREKVGGYREQAKSRSGDWAGDAKTKASGLAREGKTKASEALTGLSRVVEENAPTIDENLGSQYGDYARTASRKLQETAQRLDQKSVEELGDDAREFVRKSPG